MTFTSSPSLPASTVAASPSPSVALKLAAGAGCCALALALAVALGLDTWAVARAALPRPGTSLAMVALTVLGLSLLCATAVTARRVVRRLQARIGAQDLELDRLGSLVDVEQRVAQQAKLRALWAALPAGVLVHDRHGRIVEANPVAERVLGEPLVGLRQRDPADPRWRGLGADTRTLGIADEPVQRVLHTGRSLHGETIGVHTPGGGLRWLSLNAEPQRDPQGRVTGAVSCFVDITEQRGLQQQLAQSPAGPRAARTATELQLGDHSTVLLRVEQALSHLHRHPGYGFAVLCLAFETDPAAEPHAAGRAQSLQAFAARLLQLLRPGDAVAHGGTDPELAACVGGDGFVAVLDGVGDETTVVSIVRRLHADLCEAGVTTVGGAPPAFSVSVGAAACNRADDALTAADLLRQAELALAEAKLTGASAWRLYDPARADSVILDQAQHSELRQALAEGELFVVYQPVVRLTDRSLAGVEALLRWRHPARGMVPPLALVDLAESGRLGAAVAEVVWREACTQFMRWQHTLGALAPPRLSLNLSAAELERPGLLERLRAVLEEAGMPPQQLQVEFTECAGGSTTGVRAAALAGLKAHGVLLALDDFGTGDSSLARLHGAPLDVVKIDPTFVRHGAGRAHHRMLIEATVRVAAERGITVVAEGIESASEAALMAELGCDQGQGFLFSRPLPADAFTGWLRAGVAGS